MVDIKDYKNIYFVGIGGISMSGIALILKRWNYNIWGSNNVKSKQTDWVEKQGIKVNIGQVEDNITKDIDLIVYTAAVKEDNPEMVKARKLGIKCVERGEFLGELTKLFKDTIGVAGTHGKTSTTSMLALSFIEAGLDPSIQVGATLNAINGNYRVGNSDYFIIEACEYHNSYHSFKQKSAIVLNVDDDHLDFFKNIGGVEESFEKYVNLLPNDGFLVINRDDKRCYELRNHTKASVITVGKGDDADWYYKNVTYDEEGYPSFDVYHKGRLVDHLTLRIRGVHNIFNCLCCVAMCDAYEIGIDTVKRAILKFTGAERRLEYKGMINGARIYDDYGHHPTEIKATFEGIKHMKYNSSWAVFEAHTFSRLKDHLEEFADSLKDFDNIIVMDIYPARETNIFNIHEEDLIKELEKLNKKAIHISDYNEIASYIKGHVKEGDIVITIGAGNATKIASLLLQ